MPGRVPTEQAVEPLHQKEPIPTTLEPAEIPLHVGSPPRGVPGQLPDVVPIGIVGPHDDHRVVTGAAAQSAGARGEHAVYRFAIPALAIAPIFLLLRSRRVVAYPKSPDRK